MKNFSTLALAVVATFALTACGGGGSTSTPAPTPTPTPGPTVVAANLQTSVPAPTYDANSPAFQSFNRLNELRKKFGFGLLKQDSALDLSTQYHLAYSIANNNFDHVEVLGKPSFYAASVGDRAMLAGFGTANVGEVLAIGVPGLTAVDDLFNSILHRSTMLDQTTTEVGIAAVVQGNFTPTVIDMGRKSTGQNNASDFVTVIPADKDSAVPLHMAMEIPSPFVDVTTEQLPANTTSPISLIVAAGKVLSVTSFTVVEAGQTVALDVRLSTSATDPTKTLRSHEAHITGKTPFKPNTSYNVSFVGSADGVAINKQWSFTTSSN